MHESASLESYSPALYNVAIAAAVIGSRVSPPDPNE